MQVWIHVLIWHRLWMNFCLAVNDGKGLVYYAAHYGGATILGVSPSGPAASSGSSWSRSAGMISRGAVHYRAWGLGPVDDLVESKRGNFNVWHAIVYFLGPLCANSRRGRYILRLIEGLHIFLHLELSLSLLTVALESINQVSQLLVGSVLHMGHSLDVCHRLIWRRADLVVVHLLLNHLDWRFPLLLFPSSLFLIKQVFYFLLLDIFLVISVVLL